MFHRSHQYLIKWTFLVRSAMNIEKPELGGPIENWKESPSMLLSGYKITAAHSILITPKIVSRRTFFIKSFSWQLLDCWMFWQLWQSYFNILYVCTSVRLYDWSLISCCMWLKLMLEIRDWRSEIGPRSHETWKIENRESKRAKVPKSRVKDGSIR